MFDQYDNGMEGEGGGIVGVRQWGVGSGGGVKTVG